jgi:hypothetical protein
MRQNNFNLKAVTLCSQSDKLEHPPCVYSYYIIASSRINLLFTERSTFPKDLKGSCLLSTRKQQCVSSRVSKNVTCAFLFGWRHVTYHLLTVDDGKRGFHRHMRPIFIQNLTHHKSLLSRCALHTMRFLARPVRSTSYYPHQRSLTLLIASARHPQLGWANERAGHLTCACRRRYSSRYCRAWAAITFGLLSVRLICPRRLPSAANANSPFARWSLMSTRSSIMIDSRLASTRHANLTG